jgi:mono/diheme cytochrome c family protein
VKRALAILTLSLLATAPANAAESRVEQGKRLYDKTCALCHDARGHAATLIGKRLGKEKAVLTERTDLQPQYIAYAVRHGVGSMPWYRRAELTDVELASVSAYLTQKKPAPARQKQSGKRK